MNNIRNSNHYSKYSELFDMKNIINHNFDKVVRDILMAFSVYLDNYDKDYLYNYKFIESHIDCFLKSLKKTESIQEQCEKIKKIIINTKNKKNLLEFMKIIKNNESASLSIILNNAIEISLANKNDKEVIRINKKNLPPLKYASDNEFDIEIIFKFEKIEYRQIYNRVFIDEIYKESKNINKENNVSIINILEEMLEQFANYIIKINGLDKLIVYLDYLDYNHYNVNNISFNFGHIFQYYPMKHDETSGRFSSGSFKFLLKKHERLDANYWILSFHKNKKIYRVRSHKDFNKIDELKIELINTLNEKIFKEQ